MAAVAGPGGFEAFARPGGGEGLHATLLGLGVEDGRDLCPEGIAAERCGEAGVRGVKEHRHRFHLRLSARRLRWKRCGAQVIESRGTLKGQALEPHV